MNLCGITTCVDYSDLLNETLARNLHHFDDFVVVSSHDDMATREICRSHGAPCIQTDVFTENHAAFNKGMAINLGLAHLNADDWLLHIDADVALPDRFRTMLEKSGLERHVLYGADRIMVNSFKEWRALSEKRQYHHRIMVEAPQSIGARIIHEDYGYCPIGYFQLWHASIEKRYPVNHHTAAHSDLLFACQWPRKLRQLLPGVLVYHLSSEVTPTGTNWEGRITKRFGYE